MMGRICLTSLQTQAVPILGAARGTQHQAVIMTLRSLILRTSCT